jgi:uncharacterized membrane protein YfcA
MPVPPLDHHIVLLIAAAGFFAGVQNALAGGGSFITFPALLLAVFSGLRRKLPQANTDVANNTVGGVVGAILLLNTPPSFFAVLVPWLVLFATSVFAWGSFRRKPLNTASSMPRWVLILAQSCIAIYGGYFGGGIGFLMLAALTIAGQQVRVATATKNVLAMAMNAAATLIFATSKLISWPAALALCAGGIAGGLCGGWLIHRLPEKFMRGFVVMVGVALTIWMFTR